MLYAGLNMAVLYVYQLPIEFTKTFMWVANFLGLYKISAESEWSEICSSLSLLFFYYMVSISCFNFMPVSCACKFPCRSALVNI